MDYSATLIARSIDALSDEDALAHIGSMIDLAEDGGFAGVTERAQSDRSERRIDKGFKVGNEIVVL